MPEAARRDDLGSAHEKCFPASPAIEGSDTVFINGLPAVRVGDAYAAHGCGGCKPHERRALQGSTSVNINGRPAVRIGDAIDCGGMAETGSPNVFIGDESWSGLAFDPIKAKMQLLVAPTPGTDQHPYTHETYQLYKGGSLIQQGLTDENGRIEVEYDPPWTDQLRVETGMGAFIYEPNALLPPESETGTQQRLDALGFYAEPDLGEATPASGSQRYEHFQGTYGDETEADRNATLVEKTRALIP